MVTVLKQLYWVEVLNEGDEANSGSEDTAYNQPAALSHVFFNWFRGRTFVFHVSAFPDSVRPSYKNGDNDGSRRARPGQP